MAVMIVLGSVAAAMTAALSWRRTVKQRAVEARGEARRATLDARWRGSVEGRTADRQRAA